MQETFCLTDHRFWKVRIVTEWYTKVIFASGFVLQIQCSYNIYYAVTYSVLCCKVRLKNVGAVMTCHIVLRLHNKILYSCQIFIIYKKTELDMGWGVLLLPLDLHIIQTQHHINFSQVPRCKISSRFYLDPSTSQVRLMAVLACLGAFAQSGGMPIICVMSIRLPVRPSFRLSACISTTHTRYMYVRFYIENFYENVQRIYKFD